MSNKGGYEIGMTYVKSSKVYLAVSDVLLVTWKNGGLVEIKPYSKYDIAREITVKQICRKWKITVEQLDEETRGYFTPYNCKDSRPSGKRRQPSDPIRLVKIFKGPA